MYKTHFLFPEQQWAAFLDGAFLRVFDTYEEAQEFCEEHNSHSAETP